MAFFDPVAVDGVKKGKFIIGGVLQGHHCHAEVHLHMEVVVIGEFDLPRFNKDEFFRCPCVLACLQSFRV